MQLKTIDGKLSLGSAYKLFVVGWVIGIGGFFLAIFLIIILTAFLGAPVTINGEIVEGHPDSVLAVLPMLILVPVIVIFHAFMFGGLWLLGLVIYRLKSPITVIDIKIPTPK